MSGLDALFRPASIALVGASDASRWSLFTSMNLAGFDGPVHHVNPRAATVHGKPAYPSIAAVPSPVDLVYVMVPTPVVLPVLREAAAAGVRSAVVLTAGFADAGVEGRALQEDVVAFARDSGMTVLGPNGNGYINAAAGITPYGLPLSPTLPRGPVGLVLQSGALASALLTFAEARDVGISLLVSMGNEAMVSLTDVVDHLVDDPATRVVALFVEEIRHPAEFARVARRALRAGKPIVALKVGRSVVGARAAVAHTGALTGDEAVVDAAFRQLGVVRVASMEDLVVTAGLLAETGPLPGSRVGVVTPSGGACEIIADRAEDEGVDLPPFAAATVEELRGILPPFATVQNPLDVTGQILVDTTLLSRSLEAVARDPATDVTVVTLDLPRVEPPFGVELIEERLRATADLVAGVDRPVLIMSNTVADITPFGRTLRARTGLPLVTGGIDHGMGALGRALWWSERYRRAAAAHAPAALDGPAPLPSPARDGLALVASAGLPVVPTERVTSAVAAADAAERIGFPVVVKVDGDVAHKTDVGGVHLDLADRAQVRAAYEDVVAAARSAGARVAGAVVQPLRRGGVELLVGVVRDPAWGPALAVGLGGVWVEVLRDSAVRVLPVEEAEIAAMLAELRAAPLLDGARGAEPVDRAALVEVIARFADLAVAAGPDLESLEINPLFVRGSTIEALDALAVWRAVP